MSDDLNHRLVGTLLFPGIFFAFLCLQAIANGSASINRVGGIVGLGLLLLGWWLGKETGVTPRSFEDREREEEDARLAFSRWERETRTWKGTWNYMGRFERGLGIAWFLLMSFLVGGTILEWAGYR